MSQHFVCLSFDFDAMSGMVARGLKTPTPVSRGEFGAIGAQRILDLLKGRGIQSSWFIPGVVIGTYPDICRRIAAEGHEIGNHGWTHVPPASLSPDVEEAGLARTNAAIAEITGKAPAGYRSPSWDLSDASVDLLIKHGFVYDSSMMGHDHHPYFVRQGDVVPDDEPMVFGEETRLLELPISWSLDDFPHFEYLRTPNGVMPGLANTNLVLQNWLDDFAYMKRTEQSGLLTYTFHPYVIGRGHRMLLLERLIDALEKAGATFVTLEVAAQRYLAADR